jgi:formylmethanofuran dehydrogenase subunit E-like metal-binding protein
MSNGNKLKKHLIAAQKILDNHVKTAVGLSPGKEGSVLKNLPDHKQVLEIEKAIHVMKESVVIIKTGQHQALQAVVKKKMDQSASLFKKSTDQSAASA